MIKFTQSSSRSRLWEQNLSKVKIHISMMLCHQKVTKKGRMCRFSTSKSLNVIEQGCVGGACSKVCQYGKEKTTFSRYLNALTILFILYSLLIYTKSAEWNSLPSHWLSSFIGNFNKNPYCCVLSHYTPALRKIIAAHCIAQDQGIMGMGFFPIVWVGVWKISSQHHWLFSLWRPW